MILANVYVNNVHVIKIPQLPTLHRNLDFASVIATSNFVVQFIAYVDTELPFLTAAPPKYYPGYLKATFINQESMAGFGQ